MATYDDSDLQLSWSLWKRLLEIVRSRVNNGRAQNDLSPNTHARNARPSPAETCFIFAISLSAGQGSLSAGETEIWLCVVTPGFNIDSWTLNPAT